MLKSILTINARHSFLEYAALTPTLAVTMRKPPHIIIAKNTVSFAPSILKKSLLIAFPPRINIAKDTAYSKSRE